MANQITNIPGIGDKTAEILAAHGFKTVSAIARSTVEKLSSVPGFGPSRSGVIIAAAIALLDEPARQPQPTAATAKAKKAAGGTGARAKAAAGKKMAEKKAIWTEKRDQKTADADSGEKSRQAKLKKKQQSKEKARKEKLKKEKQRKEKARKEKLRKEKQRKEKARKEKLRKEKQRKEKARKEKSRKKKK